MAKSLVTKIMLGGGVDPSLNKAFGKVAKLAMGAFSIGAIKDFASASIQAAKDQIVAGAKMESLMRLNMDATDAQIQKIYALTDAQEALGVIEGDVQVAGAQELSTYLGLTDSLETLLPAMNDVIAQQYDMEASQEAAVSIATMMGKVMDGQVGALSRYGYTFDENQEKILKFGTESQRAAVLAQVVADSVGGVNAALGDTDLGRMKQAEMMFGRVQEEVGMKLIPMLADIAEFILPYAYAGVDKIAAGVGRLQAPLHKALDVGGKLADVVMKSGSFFMDNWGLIGPVIYGVVGAMAAYKTITIASNAVSAVMKALSIQQTAITGTQTAAQWSLNAAMSANPIGVVVTAIGLLIAAGVLLYQNWDVVTAKLGAAWDGIKSFFAGGINFITSKINVLINGLNSIKIPEWVPGLGGVGFNLPTIPQLARGATISSPTLALIGEAGTETVVPHNNRPRSRALLSEAARGVGGFGGDVYRITYAPVIQGGGENVAEILTEQFRLFQEWIEVYLGRRGRVEFA